jgi:hypothetical protein
MEINKFIYDLITVVVVDKMVVVILLELAKLLRIRRSRTLKILS